MPLEIDRAERLDQRLGDEALGDDVGADPRAGEARGRCRGRSRRAWPRRARARRARHACERLEEEPHPVRAGQADQVVVARSPPRPRATSARLESRHDPDRGQLDHRRAQLAQGRGQPARLGAGAGDDDPAPVSGRRSSQASARRRSTTAPTTISAGAPIALALRPPRRSLRVSRSPCAGPPSVPRSIAAAGSSGSRPAVDQRPRVSREPLDAHVEDERAGEARRAPPSRAPVSGFSGSSWPVTKATAEASSRWVTGIPA